MTKPRKPVGLKNHNPFKYHIGPSNVLKAIGKRDPAGSKIEAAKAIALLLALFPGMSQEIANLVYLYPEEVRVNGANLLIPRSWGPQHAKTAENNGDG